MNDHQDELYDEIERRLSDLHKYWWFDVPNLIDKYYGDIETELAEIQELIEDLYGKFVFLAFYITLQEEGG